jgi:hypothetical protein
MGVRVWRVEGEMGRDGLLCGMEKEEERKKKEREDKERG